ncbi:MAG: glutathione S-transferase family protein [Pseudomonadota bacterium]
MSITLHQFAFSHFNEKARWALAFKGIEHQRETYLPGPHMGAVRKLSGQTSTPVLEADGEVVAGSAAIIDYLERSQPTPALYPELVEERAAALELQTHFDAEVGPAVRTALFSALVEEGGYLCQMFAGSKGLPKRVAYRALFPLARGLIAKGNGVTDPETVEGAFAGTRKALDTIAARTAATGYCVGQAFTVADLTVAALFAPIAQVKHLDMKRPEPMPERVQAVIAQFADHPAVAWVQQIYARHRP